MTPACVGYAPPVIKQVLSSQRVPVKIWTDDVESSAMDQLENTAALPFVFHHVAAMPDVHWGMGATVGSVIATRGAICPAAVGVDIGCGMAAVKTPYPVSMLDGKLPELRHSIERGVPVGFNQHRAAKEGLPNGPSVATGGEISKAALQLGTLGGGNHFIEICRDLDDDAIWIMLHSGSRHIGKVTAEKHIGKAKGDMKKLFVDLPDPDLAYFVQGTPQFEAYVQDLLWCQRYAARNRSLMMREVRKNLAHALGVDELARAGEEIDCHHNYVAEELHFGEKVLVTRKGAINAEKGRLGIIPGSMGTGSFIVSGLGNSESFHSAPHGAGRKMSRGKAKKTFTVADLAAQTAGVECRKDAGVLDEIPGAYKPIGEVIENSADLVRVEARLKQVLTVKG